MYRSPVLLGKVPCKHAVLEDRLAVLIDFGSRATDGSIVVFEDAVADGWGGSRCDGDSVPADNLAVVGDGESLDDG